MTRIATRKLVGLPPGTAQLPSIPAEREESHKAKTKKAKHCNAVKSCLGKARGFPELCSQILFSFHTAN
jgi:hypothetical protein